MASKEFDARVTVEDYDPAKAREKADKKLAEEMAEQKKLKKAANEWWYDIPQTHLRINHHMGFRGF